MDEEMGFFNRYSVDGKPIEAKSIGFGHLKTLAGIGRGVPDWVDEHRVRDLDHKGIWECTSYPGLVDAVAEELEPVRKEIAAVAATGVAPFDDIETALKTPITGLYIMAGMLGGNDNLDNWHDLDL